MVRRKGLILILFKFCRMRFDNEYKIIITIIANYYLTKLIPDTPVNGDTCKLQLYLLFL